MSELSQQLHSYSGCDCKYLQKAVSFCRIWISLCISSTASSSMSQNVIIGHDFYINNTFDIFLMYTTRDHTANHAETYSKITPEETKVPEPDKLRRRQLYTGQRNNHMNPQSTFRFPSNICGSLEQKRYLLSLVRRRMVNAVI